MKVYEQGCVGMLHVGLSRAAQMYVSAQVSRLECAVPVSPFPGEGEGAGEGRCWHVLTLYIQVCVLL